MQVEYGPSLSVANRLLRDGRYQEAKNMFALLKDKKPNFLPYRQGYAFACEKLGVTPSGELATTRDGFVLESIHPSSQNITTVTHPLLFVVTPVFNGERFIATTLESILSQTGNFFIDYLVKDARSTDKTLRILQEFQQRIASGQYPLKCSGIRFRVDSCPDRGLYDALAYAFARHAWRSESRTIQTYLNADDVMEVGAFNAAANVFQSTRAKWVTGQTRVIDETGKLIVAPQFPLTYAREDIAAGLHDGRLLYTIQQEGTFWLQELYELSGGIDPQYKLAGDFDLWRRYALHCEVLTLDRPLASFRSHQEQLSKSIEKYRAEVDDSVASGDVAPEQPIIWPYFYIGAKAPQKAPQQRPGPVGFMDEGGQIKEIAYVKRGWACW